MATAHNPARIAYHLLTHRIAYWDRSAAEYEQRVREREIATLRNRATGLGLSPVDSSA